MVADPAVRVALDQVDRGEQPQLGQRQAGLLAHLARDRLAQRLAQLLRAARAATTGPARGGLPRRISSTRSPRQTTAPTPTIGRSRIFVLQLIAALASRSGPAHPTASWTTPSKISASVTSPISGSRPSSSRRIATSSTRRSEQAVAAMARGQVDAGRRRRGRSAGAAARARDRARAPASRRDPAASGAPRHPGGRPPPAASRARRRSPTIRRIRSVSTPLAWASAPPAQRFGAKRRPEWRNRSPSSSAITSSAGRPSRARISPPTTLVTWWVGPSGEPAVASPATTGWPRANRDRPHPPPMTVAGDLHRRAAGGDQARRPWCRRRAAASSASRRAGPASPISAWASSSATAVGDRAGRAGIRKPPRAGPGPEPRGRRAPPPRAAQHRAAAGAEPAADAGALAQCPHDLVRHRRQRLAADRRCRDWRPAAAARAGPGRRPARRASFARPR